MGQRPCNQKIVGFTTFGMAVPLFRGAEDPPLGDQNSQGHQQYQQQQQYTPPDPSQQQQQPDPTQQQAPPDTVSRQEYDDLMRRMQAADRNKSGMEAKLKEYEDKDKTELEKAQRDAQEAIARAEKAEKELQESHVEREFLKLPGYDWHDAGDALRLLDRSEVQINDDGTVKGVKEAAEKLKKSKPFMLKSQGDDDKDKDKVGKDGKDGNNGGQQNGGSATGNNPGPPNDANNRNTDRDRLMKKFPALGRR